MDCYVLKDIRFISNDCVKVFFDTGPSFYFRIFYCTDIRSIEKRLLLESEFTEYEYEQMTSAGLAYIAELKAMEYLARSEHSRFGLYTKLIKNEY